MSTPLWRSWLARLSHSWGLVSGRRRFRRTRSSHPCLEWLEDRDLPSVTIAASNNSGQGYSGLDFNHSGGYVPPDTNGAAGPNSYVETVNQEIALYTPKSTGSTQTLNSLSNF